MKNSFFLVIPERKKNAELLAAYEKTVVNQWVLELPSANPSLSTRLFYDFIEALNTLEMPAQQRLDVLEILRPQYLLIEDYLRSRVIQTGFPKGENDRKILSLIVAIEKQMTIGYWSVTRELTRRDIGWFQGKNTALALQRTIKGLSALVVTHYMMFLPVPDWVWIDLHSLYRLSVKQKKESTKVTDSQSGANSSAEDCYKQVLLLSLADPSGLMQKEVQQIFHFIGKVCSLVQIESEPVADQEIQCIIQVDEDIQPYFEKGEHHSDASVKYLNFSKLFKALGQGGKFCSTEEARFSSMYQLKHRSDKLPVGLFEYILQCWKGVELKGASIFFDRLDRYIAIGLDATHSLQTTLEDLSESPLEVLAESFSDSELSCKFEKHGVLSIGSLVSFRKTKEPQGKRCLGVVKKITMPKQDSYIVFELTVLTPLSYAVTYKKIEMSPQAVKSPKKDDEQELVENHKALIYGVKTETGEKSYIIMESFMHKDGDIMRLYMNDENFPIVLGDRKNIGLGYWQFECRRLEEKYVQVAEQQEVKKKGYDFI